VTWVKHPGFWGNGGTARSRHTRAASRHFVGANLAGMVWPGWAKNSGRVPRFFRTFGRCRRLAS